MRKPTSTAPSHAVRPVFCILTAGLIVFAQGCATATKVHPDDYRAHIAVLADDRFAGRGLGSPGIDMAADYIAEQFEALGIEPAAGDGSYFQRCELPVGVELTDDHEFTLSGVDVSPQRREDFMPFGFSSNDSFDGDVVFVGYGIVNEEKEHDDYYDIDVEGKVVLMLRREPPGWDTGSGFSRFAQFRNKIYTAKEKNVAAVLIANQISDDGDDRLMRFRRRGGGQGMFGVPAIHIKRSLANAMLEAGGLESLDSLQARVDQGTFASAPLNGVRLKGHAGVEAKTAAAQNVIGLIRGEGPLADQYVVIGAHYDHLGETVPMSMFRRPDRPGEPQIHNGADDNASGTAGMIEAGRLLMEARPLKRSVLLMAFTGEESGLLGSNYYVEHPVVPLEDTVAMINLDMIGRLNKNTISIFGTKAADEFEEMIVRLTKKSGMKLEAGESALGPSDHTSFYRQEIPSMHFFTGVHTDWHQPGDDVEKINAKGGSRVTDLVVAMAREIIDADQRPTYHEVKARARISRSGSNVVMGIMPGYADSSETPGQRVKGVHEGGPAEAAGMKGGDLIIKIGTMEVAGIYDYMGALRNNKAGDEVEVVVLRDGNEVTLKVKLAAR